jgi:hypothetical protein
MLCCDITEGLKSGGRCPQVLHMECKETGEFAHRETTEYEQVSPREANG